MRIYSPADQLFQEIVSIGTRFPHPSRWTAQSDQGAVEYWSPQPLVPKLALEFVDLIAASISIHLKLDSNAFRLRIRMAPAKAPDGHFEAFATLLWCVHDDDSDRLLERLRSAAARLLAAMCRPIVDRASESAESNTAGFLREDEAELAVDSLVKLPVAALLGTGITDDLVAVVPGRKLLALPSKLRDYPPQPIESQAFEVRGRISTTKSKGRSRSVGVDGFRVDTREKFKAQQAVFGEDLRERVANAVREPGRSLLMQLTRTSVYCGLSKPKITVTLTDLRFDEQR